MTGLPLIEVVAYEGVEPIDIGATIGVLSMARRVLPDLRWTLVAAEAGPVMLASDLTVVAGHGLADAPAPGVVIVLGGPGWEAASRDARLLGHLRRRHDAGALMASVCTGAMILAAAGILDGRPATTKTEIMPGETRPLDLLAAHPGVEALTARIVDDGDVITGGGVSLGHDLTLHLVARIAGEQAARETARILEYSAARNANALRLGDINRASRRTPLQPAGS